ncbi:MAG TPA: hypothetical protein ENH00_05045 [Actinobacteria bacterium]|nr:hypothetical protein BMS3Bbin01_01524 [bacterium BMS3Bbin01]HDH25547.1 hypothetical protein [Actinomycetota bacterium]
MRRMFSFRSPIVIVALLYLLFRAFDSRGSDLSSTLLLLGALAAVALLAAATISWWNGRQNQRSRTARVEETKRELRRRLDDVANDILRLEEQVRTSDDAAVLAHFRDASVAYASILKDLDEPNDTRELNRLATRLDTAIWNLDAAEATMAGQPAQPRPRQTLTPSRRGQNAERAGRAGIERRDTGRRRRSSGHRSRRC